MKQTPYFLLLFFVITGCGILICPTTRDFKYRTYHPYPGLDSILNVDGYYANLDSSLVHPGDGNFAVMFYRDGTSASYLYLTSGAYDCLTDDYQKKRRNLKWGRFYICGDTIKSQEVGASGLWVPNDIYESHYLIEGKNKIRLIREINYFRIKLLKGNYPSGKYPEHVQSASRGDDTLDIELYFVPLPERIDSASWIKKKRFYWK